MTTTPLKSSSSPGFSLLEVMIVAVVLGICALALGQAMMGAMHQTRTADEMRAASFAARQKMEEVLGKSIPSIQADYAPSTAGQAFQVNLNDSPLIRLQGPGGAPAGEVVIIDREDAVPGALGRNLDGVGGGDGVTMCPWPVDLNGDNVIPSTGAPNRIVIGIVVRWIAYTGLEQRYELWSVR